MVANNSKTTGGATGKGFKPGQSGNPNGRPKIADEFRGKCREFMSDEGWEKLKAITDDPKHRDYFRALELIMGYSYGKPKQGLALTGEEGGNINVIIEPASKHKNTDQ